MRTVLIIHGIGGHAGIHWQQWFSNALTAKNYHVIMPNLPSPNQPDRKTWLAEINKALEGVELADLVLVGHSLGATTAMDFVEQTTHKVNGLITVSGFAKDYGSELNAYFLNEKSINFEKVKDNISWSKVVYGDNDPYVTQEALKYVSDGLSVEPVILPNGGHLNSEAGYTELSLLVDILESSTT